MPNGSGSCRRLDERTSGAILVVGLGGEKSTLRSAKLSAARPGLALQARLLSPFHR